MRGCWRHAVLGVAAVASAGAAAQEARQQTIEQVRAAAMSADLPDMNFSPTPAIAADFDKYFYFHRPATDFETAQTDVTECHALALGLRGNVRANSTLTNFIPYQYGLAGAVGGSLIGSIIQTAAAGAEARRAQRNSYRRCMNWRGYQRYGTTRDIWRSFNVEDGLSPANANARARATIMQARIASGPTPTTQEIGR